MTAPETMVSWSGTKHIVGADHRMVSTGRASKKAACSASIYLNPAHQDRPHRKDCRRCFPAVQAGDPAVESARSIAAKLEAENAELRPLVERIATDPWPSSPAAAWHDLHTDAQDLLARLNPTGDQP